MITCANVERWIDNDEDGNISFFKDLLFDRLLIISRMGIIENHLGKPFFTTNSHCATWVQAGIVFKLLGNY